MADSSYWIYLIYHIVIVPVQILFANLFWPAAMKYIQIMKEGFGDRFTFRKEIDPLCMETEFPSLILQPIVENTFKHRLEADSLDLIIDIAASCR